MERRHRVVAVVTPPQSTFELACVAEVFGIEHPGVPTRYSFDVCAETPGALPTKAGYRMLIEHGLDVLGTADSVFVTGWPDRLAQPSPELARALTDAHARGARIVGICSGTFALAAIGLLDGREATTHWRMAEELQARYPRVAVRPHALYVDHGDVATSAGTGAAVDLALELVRRDFGAAYAADIARHMVLPPHRDGGQRQYSWTPPDRNAPEQETLAAILAWAEENLHRPIVNDDLATRGAVSSRTLARLFDRHLGTTPGKWLLRRRIEQARALLERTDAPVAAIGAATGFPDSSNFRRRFSEEVGTTPGSYRRTFGHPGGPSGS
ncbi:helix-turn-helix domain-containing protein [Amycolatopsis cynarae]|uniref:Helix-turn-helix domain-containing protein n=1 Tax=Amycolatopsis cynarae TaxID=2995223 RepID=A0ABY7B255_9PSEU|nr:helix-turn-helix domain-containing protein [Amycolatopsis sp. HUAS 11-8]WAL66386.1 helix-turn-helix domain-containing protein [Amycolatopsis sp. HUAS 11-8]